MSFAILAVLIIIAGMLAYIASLLGDILAALVAIRSHLGAHEPHLRRMHEAVSELAMKQPEVRHVPVAPELGPAVVQHLPLAKHAAINPR